MNPRQAFEILLNIPEPRRTPVLTDGATALPVSEILGLIWMDLDFADQVIEVKRAYVWAQFKVPQVEGPRTDALGACRLSDGVEGRELRTRRMTITSSRASGLRARGRCRLR